MAFDQAIASEVCERLATGEPLSRICRTPGYPDPSTVWRWREDNPSFAQAIARAREIGHDVIADDCMDIADSAAEPADKRVRVDTRLKLLAKWDPKRYGERIDHTHDVTSRILLVDARSAPAPSQALTIDAQVVTVAAEQLTKDDETR